MKRLLKRIAGITMMCAVLSLSVQSVKATEIAGADSAIISVESYEVEEGALVAGEQVTINFTVKNTQSSPVSQSAKSSTRTTVLTAGHLI